MGSVPFIKCGNLLIHRRLISSDVFKVWEKAMFNFCDFLHSIHLLRHFCSFQPKLNHNDLVLIAPGSLPLARNAQHSMTEWLPPSWEGPLRVRQPTGVRTGSLSDHRHSWPRTLAWYPTECAVQGVAADQGLNLIRFRERLCIRAFYSLSSEYNYTHGCFCCI